jgi:hypothetical protein
MFLCYNHVRDLPIACVVFNILTVPGFRSDPVFKGCVPGLAVMRKK